MAFLDTRKFLLSSKKMKGPPVHINDVVINLCKKKILLFSGVWEFTVPYYIHDYVIKNQSTGHNTSRIIITHILLFNWIQNMVICQGDIVLWR